MEYLLLIMVPSYQIWTSVSSAAHCKDYGMWASSHVGRILHVNVMRTQQVGRAIESHMRIRWCPPICESKGSLPYILPGTSCQRKNLNKSQMRTHFWFSFFTECQMGSQMRMNTNLIVCTWIGEASYFLASFGYVNEASQRVRRCDTSPRFAFAKEMFNGVATTATYLLLCVQLQNENQSQMRMTAAHRTCNPGHMWFTHALGFADATSEKKHDVRSVICWRGCFDPSQELGSC